MHYSALEKIQPRGNERKLGVITYYPRLGNVFSTRDSIFPGEIPTNRYRQNASATLPSTLIDDAVTGTWHDLHKTDIVTVVRPSVSIEISA